MNTFSIYSLFWCVSIHLWVVPLTSLSSFLFFFLVVQVYTSDTSRPFDYYLVPKSLLVLWNVGWAAIWLLWVLPEFLLDCTLVVIIVLRLRQSFSKTVEVFRKLNCLKQLILTFLPHVCRLGIGKDMTAIEAKMSNIDFPLVNASLDFSAAEDLSTGRAHFGLNCNHVTDQAFQVLWVLAGRLFINTLDDFFVKVVHIWGSERR